ncbi:MAG: T9SS type A sorting domain-containing protein [Chitinophagales bacterium]
MKNKKQQVAQYSALALIFIALHEKSNAQVIYTDINPDDTVLNDVAGGLAYIDMDNNGSIDFFFLNNTFISTTMPYDSSVRTYERIWAGPQASENSIAASRWSYYGYTIFIRYFPYALSPGDTIPGNMDFQNWELQRMAYRTLAYSILLSTPVTHDGGFWFSDYGDITDKYLGVRFADDAGLYHYGWIRCDVKDTARTLIIKDYAYETEPEKPILAGDTVSYVQIHDDYAEGVVTAYSSASTLYILFQTKASDAVILIYDLQGSLIERMSATSNINMIDMSNYIAGVYLVNIQYDGNTFLKKISTFK